MDDRVFLASKGGDYFSPSVEVGEKNREFRIDDDSYFLKSPYYWVSAELLFRVLECAIASGWVETYDDGSGEIVVQERDIE